MSFYCNECVCYFACSVLMLLCHSVRMSLKSIKGNLLITYYLPDLPSLTLNDDCVEVVDSVTDLQFNRHVNSVAARAHRLSNLSL